MEKSRLNSIKIVVIGSKGCGKTTLIQRWVKGTEKENEEKGSEMYCVEKQRLGCRVRVFIVEFSENFVQNEDPFKSIDAYFLCYDISNFSSFLDLDKKWRPLLDAHGIIAAKKPIFVVGCKGDLQPAIDPTLIKLTKPYVHEDFVVNDPEHSDTPLNALVDKLMEEKELNVMKTWVSLRNIGDFPHQFELKYFPTPTWCKFCNLFIWGVASPQGYQCRVCGYTAHKRCKDDVPDMCKQDTLLGDAISTITRKVRYKAKSYQNL